MERVLAMVLAGGRVDELLCLTERRPKSALPIFGNYRIIDFCLSNLMHAGIFHVGVLSQYRPYALVRHIGSGEHWDFIGRKREIRILPPYRGARASDWYKGTADAVYQNLSYIEEFNPEHTLILSADHIYRMDYRDLWRFHLAKGAEVTIAFTRARSKTARFGYGRCEKDGRLREYRQKPDTPISDWVSMTVYLFKTEVLIDLLKHNARESSHEFGGDIIPCLIPEIKTYAYRFVDYWAYARTVDSYYQTNMDLLRQKIPLAAWQIRTNLIERCNNAERLPAYCDGPVTNSVIGDGCVVKGRVRNSILSPGVIVEAGAEVADSIIFHDTRIGPDAVLKKVICDKDVQISEGARIGGDDRPHAKEKRDHQKPGIAVLGKGSIVPARTRIKADTVVYPSAVIDQAEIGPGEILR